jgi:O-antigen/teichoic acid export membrane protein
MSLARAVAWNTLVQIVGRLVGLLASIALTALIIRHLGTATYGQYTAASAYVSLFMILGEFGLYLVAIRRASQEPEQRARILGTALGLRLTWTLVPLGIAVLGAQLIPSERYPTYASVVKSTIAILALNEYVRLLCQFLTGVFRMHLRMELAVVGEVGSRVLALLGVGLVAQSGGGLRWVAAALLVANSANLAWAWLMSQRLERFRARLDSPLVRQLAREAVVVAGVLILSLLRGQIGILLLSLMRPSEEVGIYGVAIKVYEVLITFPGMLIALLYPVLSRLASEDRERLRRIFQRTFDVMLLAATGLCLLVEVLALQIAAILGEPRASQPMRILVLALPGAFVGMSFTHLVLAEGRQGLILRLYLLLAIASTAANVFLIPRVSYMGVGSTLVATETTVMLTLAVYWTRIRDLNLQLRTLWSLPIAVVIGWLAHRLAAAWIDSPELDLQWRLLVVVGLGCVIAASYVAAVLGLRLVQMDVIRSLLPGGNTADV